jgi:hypothetical protein
VIKLLLEGIRFSSQELRFVSACKFFFTCISLKQIAPGSFGGNFNYATFFIASFFFGTLSSLKGAFTTALLVLSGKSKIHKLSMVLAPA